MSQRLIFGSYPDVVSNPADAEEIVKNLASSYLYKDVFSLMSIKRPEALERLTLLLALQIGSEVSYNELAANLGADISTGQNYIGLLEENFIVFRLGAYSRNVRNEIKKSRKIYFWDTGIPNALIDNFKPIDLRVDKGALWENYLIAERLKTNTYGKSSPKVFLTRKVRFPS